MEAHFQKCKASIDDGSESYTDMNMEIIDCDQGTNVCDSRRTSICSDVSSSGAGTSHKSPLSLPSISGDFHLLGLFVRGCKHDRVRTRRKLERFWCARATHTDLYVGRHLADYALALSFIEMVPLPSLTADGCRVTMHRVRPAPAADAPWTALDIVRYSLAIVDVRMASETVIAGDVFVYDLSAMRAAGCARLAAPSLRRALALAHDAYPQRLRRVHLLHAPAVIAGLLALIRSCMKEKIRDRFMLHNTLESLHEHIDASILPREYGGAEPPLAELHARWLTALDRAAPARDQLAMRAAVARHSSAVSPTDYDVGAFRRLDID